MKLVFFSFGDQILGRITIFVLNLDIIISINEILSPAFHRKSLERCCDDMMTIMRQKTNDNAMEHRVVAITPSCYRFRTIASSHYRYRLVAQLHHHRHRIIALSTQSSIVQWSWCNSELQGHIKNKKNLHRRHEG